MNENMYPALNEFLRPDFQPQNPSLLKSPKMVHRIKKISCILPYCQWKKNKLLLSVYRYWLYLACWGHSPASSSHSCTAYNNRPMFWTCQRFCLLKQTFRNRSQFNTHDILLRSLTQAGIQEEYPPAAKPSSIPSLQI